MLITDEFEVDHPIDKVWEFFDDIPGVARGRCQTPSGISGDSNSPTRSRRSES